MSRFQRFLVSPVWIEAFAPERLRRHVLKNSTSLQLPPELQAQPDYFRNIIGFYLNIR
jgi:hypothetical protein